MKTLTVSPKGEVQRAKKNRKKLKKIGISIGMGFLLFALVFMMVLLVEKM